MARRGVGGGAPALGGAAARARGGEHHAYGDGLGPLRAGCAPYRRSARSGAVATQLLPTAHREQAAARGGGERGESQLRGPTQVRVRWAGGRAGRRGVQQRQHDLGHDLADLVPRVRLPSPPLMPRGRWLPPPRRRALLRPQRRPLAQRRGRHGRVGLRRRGGWRVAGWVAGGGVRRVAAARLRWHVPSGARCTEVHGGPHTRTEAAHARAITYYAPAMAVLTMATRAAPACRRATIWRAARAGRRPTRRP